MTATELVSLIVGVLTVLSAVAGVTRYITRLQFKVRQERLEAEKEFSEKRASDLEARYNQLLNEVAVSRRIGTAALIRKMEIDEDLENIMEITRAGAGSIYVPLKTKESPQPLGLVFLSIRPFGKQAERLKRKIIPMQSSAGRCFAIGKPYTAPNAKVDPAHYGKADKVSGYHTEDLLNYPLRYHGEVVGVLQLLNKEGPERFTDHDILLVEPFAGALAEKVADFVLVPEYLEILGIAQERGAECATIMFCDLSHSSLLFQELSVSVAIQYMNEYFERICDIGLGHGATVDKYIGDGVLLRFNVPRRVRGHPLKAATAALEMRAAFENLRAEWKTMGSPVTSLYLRIGIAYGEVYEAVVGHPQYQYLTVFGQPVNIAVNLCEAAVRDRDVIVIDERMYRELSGKILAEQLPRERLGKAIAYVESVYELKGLTSEHQGRGRGA